MNNERTHVAFTVGGEATATLLSIFLVVNSIEFHLDPFPNDKWNFVMKNESGRVLKVSKYISVLKSKWTTVYCDGWN